MLPRGYGRIVCLASTAGLRGGTGRAACGAAKGGVIALTKVKAVELAPRGIAVNALAPGAIETELMRRMHDASTRATYLSRIPMDDTAHRTRLRPPPSSCAAKGLPMSPGIPWPSTAAFWQRAS